MYAGVPWPEKSRECRKTVCHEARKGESAFWVCERVGLFVRDGSLRASKSTQTGDELLVFT